MQFIQIGVSYDVVCVWTGLNLYILLDHLGYKEGERGRRFTIQKFNIIFKLELDHYKTQLALSSRVYGRGRAG